MNQNLKITDYQERVLQEEVIYTGQIIDVVKEKVQLPDSTTAYREIVHHAPAVAIIVINQDDQMLVVHQWRAAIRAMTIEIPAGKMDERDSNPVQAAVRELNEETRLAAGTLELVTKFYSSIGFADEEIYIYHAQDLSVVQNALPQDQDEQLSLEWVDFKTMKQMFQTGQLNDVKTSLAFLYWQGLRLKAAKIR
ncbi:NUDIX hydrolase [Weissella coleopterorum]|uniref:NUDIX hydrolase n=1 Tax=Weissella coleopterorum TaxID=2714949 RepID=A0A6G8B140_9LACO|nr:NUDIX hydrolase [Weissella coleopterorum]QIL50966.1 NUDIX hydrolase [Weissella coleopterorum]